MFCLKKRKFPLGNWWKGHIKRARETESALDSLRRLQSSPCLGRYSGAGPRVPLPQQSGSSKSHLKYPKWETSAFPPDSEQSLPPDSSFLLEPMGFQELTASQVRQRQGGSRGAAEPSSGAGGRTSGVARWHAWLSWHPGDMQASPLLRRGHGAVVLGARQRGEALPRRWALLCRGPAAGMGRGARLRRQVPSLASPWLGIVLLSLGDQLMSCHPAISL